MRSVNRGSREGSERGFFLQSAALCVALHCILLAGLTFGLRFSFPRGHSVVYPVSIRGIFSPGRGTGNRASTTPANALRPPPAVSTTEKGKKSDSVTETTSVREKKGKPKERISQPSDKSEPVKSKKEDSIEGLKPSRAKKDREEKYSSDNLQRALDEVRRQAAIDRIRIRTERRGKTEKESGGPTSRGDSSTRSVPQEQAATSAASIRGPGAGGEGISGAETGGPGAGIGGTGGPGSIFGFGSGGTKLEEYYGTIWSKVKEEWTIPGNVIIKEELETIVVLLIDKQGKLQKASFEKRSGNNLYDQSAMRAIKKAEPFPPLPEELGEDSLELALRFTPD